MIDDDLYITAGTFVLDGTVNGDLIVVGRTLTINGKVDGDVIALGQTVLINGTVTGAIRTAGYALLLGEQVSIGGDLIAASYSLESRKRKQGRSGSPFRGQSSSACRRCVTSRGMCSARVFELRGTVEGSVSAGVGEADAGYAGPPPTLFIPQSPISIPVVDPGLTIIQSAQINGDLFYRQSRELVFPAGVVAGEITRTQPAGSEETTGQQILNWALNALRGEHHPDPDRLVSALAVSILYARLELQAAIGGLAQPGLGCCSLCNLFPGVVTHRCPRRPRWPALRRIDIGWRCRNDRLGRCPVISRPYPGICAGHFLRREGCLGSGAWEMASRPSQTHPWSNIVSGP